MAHLEKTAFTIAGNRGDRTNEIWVDGKKLSPNHSLRIRNHSPDGFNWGYGGSGPAQAALAICLVVFRNEAVARALYQSFKFEFVAKWQDNQFTVTIDIADFLIDHRDEYNAALQDENLSQEF